MPTITVSYEDLSGLLGIKIPFDQLSDLLFLAKCEVVGVMGDEITLELNADRPDMLSAEGIARVLRGITGVEMGPKEYKPIRGEVSITVKPSVLKVRPWIVSAVVRGLRLSDEAVRQLMQLQEKLHLTYCRNRRKVSIGLHDLDAVSSKIVYEGVKPDQIKFVPLGETREMTGRQILKETPKGREYAHLIEQFEAYPLLHDVEGRVLSMPPIINGVLTTVTSSTKNVLIDVTGTDEKLCRSILNLVTADLVERGGVVESVTIKYPDKVFKLPSMEYSTLTLSTNYVNEMVGINLADKEVVECLLKMRYGANVLREGLIEVRIPPYRLDVLHPIDLVEDVAIGYGYDKLEPVIPFTKTFGRELETSSFTRKVRDLMVGLGFQEVLNYTMTSKETLFAKMEVKPERVVEVQNPLSREYSVLRTWLTPGLLDFLSLNKHVSYPQKIFECGVAVVVDESLPNKARMLEKLAAAICDYKAGYEDVQAALYCILRNLGVNKWRVERFSHPSFIDGRVARLVINERTVAILGEISPRVLRNFYLENPVAVFEADLSALFTFLKKA